MTLSWVVCLGRVVASSRRLLPGTWLTHGTADLGSAPRSNFVPHKSGRIPYSPSSQQARCCLTTGPRSRFQSLAASIPIAPLPRWNMLCGHLPAHDRPTRTRRGHNRTVNQRHLSGRLLARCISSISRLLFPCWVSMRVVIRRALRERQTTSNGVSG
jgi:hypothetical protein